MNETQSRNFYSEAQWTENSSMDRKWWKKNQTYFLNLEKKNYSNKLITQLEANGKIIKEQSTIANAQHTFYKELYSEKINVKTLNMIIPKFFFLRIAIWKN